MPGFFAGVTLADWEMLCQRLCPERYAEPTTLPREQTTLTGADKVDVLVDRLRGGTLLRQDPLSQVCLWHFLDHDARPDLGTAGGGPWIRRARTPVPTVEQIVEQGGDPPDHWHQGMVRFEDASAYEPDGHVNPARMAIVDKVVHVVALALPGKAAVE